MGALDVVSAILGSSKEESNLAFVEEVRRLSKRGLSAIGYLGVIGTLFYVLVHVLFLNYQIGWSYPDQPCVNPCEPAAAVQGAKVLVMWDKLILFVMSLAALGASRATIGFRHGRIIVAMCVLAASGSMIIDQAMGGQSEFFLGYLTLLMFAAVGGIPFQTKQAAVMCASVLGMMLVLPPVVELFGPETLLISGRQATYWIICSVVLVGIARLVYRSRYDDFRYRREIEIADEKVRKHAAQLETSTAELEQAKQQTEEQAAKLQEMEALKSRFFAGISHEFRTPITLILGPSKDVLDKFGSEMEPEIRSALALILRSGHRLHDLVDQLLDLTRLEEGRLPVHASRQDISGFVNGVASIYEPIARARHIQFDVETDLEDPEVWFDGEHMMKVFSNLISNALKFTKDGGHIRIQIRSSTIDDDDAVAVEVRDNGVGIPSDQLDLIFDRFHQIEREEVSGGGSGIGLALVKELVELHGGDVNVTSEEGFGSTFTVRFRRGSDYLIERGFDVLMQPPPHLETVIRYDRTLEPSDEAPIETSDATLPTILVVEDNEDMRRYLRGILTDHYNVIEAENGREGLRLAAKELPSLILTDVMMPEMNGLALCAALKSNPQTSHLPVVILTAKASQEAVIEGLSTGADDYITKPFDAAELLIRTENLIEIRNALLGNSGSTGPEPSEVDEPSADQVFENKVKEIVEEHLGDSNFTVDWLAELVMMSRRQLERRLRATSRLTPAGYIRMMRLRRAAQLLEKKVGTVAEVAYRVGFSDPNYFSRLFRQTFDVPPSEYGQD